MDYADLPLPKTAYGERLYSRGRALVERHGLRLDMVMWDADEVLWDWLLHGARLAGGVWRAVLLRNYAHTEFIAPRPGMFELLWGMRHAAQDLGEDPDIRIWTSGYAWRIWRIGQQIPGLGQLLGMAAGADTAADYARSPSLFGRPDYADAAIALVNRKTRARHLDGLSAATRAVVERHLDAGDTTGLKVAELAAIVGKGAFGRVRVLVDDTRVNVDRFVETERAGVHVVSVPPTIAFGLVPNSVWGRPSTTLARLALGHADAIADALQAALGETRAQVYVAQPGPEPIAEVPAPFAIAVPNVRVQQGLAGPIRRLRVAMRAAKKGL